MKKIILLASLTLFGLGAFAQNANYAQMDSRHAERVQRRDVRNADALKTMDSIVLTRYYKFSPTTFQLEPAGNLRNIYNVFYNITLRADYIDVDIPYIKGLTPPYYVTTLNCITYDIQNYTAVQNPDGWYISFSSYLQGPNKYTFEFNVNAVSGEAILTLSSDIYNTVTYSGSFMGTY